MTDWLTGFPSLSRLQPADRQALLQESTTLDAPEDTIVFNPGQKAESLLMVLDGSVRVQHLSERGREIVLYRVKAGESCVLTTSCLLSDEVYSATGVTETPVRAVAIPRQSFDRLLGRSTAFRQFVFHMYSQRISDLFLLVEEVAFQRMDVRVSQKLLELAAGRTRLSITHQQLAAELGTAREVISRQLSEFQRRDWIQQSRGQLTLLDSAALQRIAAH